MPKIYNMITILGHTAAGKTSLAAHIAQKLDGEVIGADSRQVYRGMNIGTGKDYSDYVVNGETIPVHLLDIADAGYEYNVYEFQQDFIKVYDELIEKGKLPVLCGGTGLYIESVLRKYDLINVPINKSLRMELEKLELSELAEKLKAYKQLHNTTDVLSKERVIRAIEIAMHLSKNEDVRHIPPEMHSLNIGIRFEREERRKSITRRLEQRLAEGMIDEVKKLSELGISREKFEYYGLEYKYISRYLSGTITYTEMFNLLNTAIHQFAKRQMTYFRGMERRGVKIHWLDGTLSSGMKVKEVLKLYHSI